MWAIRRVITARWCRPARPRWFTARDGIIRRTLVPQCGTAGPTPTVWEQDSPTAPHPVGALVSGTGTATIRITTPGGDRWATTDAAGIRITDGAPGAAQRSPTCTESGATRRIRARARPGPIHTLETTEPPAAVPTTTHRPAGRQLPAAALTPTSIPATQPGIVAERPIIRTQASSREEELDTLGTSTPARARPDVVALPTTRTRMPALLPARTTSTQAKTARCTVTTGTAAAANRKLNLRLGKEYCKEDRHVSLASLSHSVRDQHLGVACRTERQVREVRRSQYRTVCRMGCGSRVRFRCGLAYGSLGAQPCGHCHCKQERKPAGGFSAGASGFPCCR